MKKQTWRRCGRLVGTKSIGCALALMGVTSLAPFPAFAGSDVAVLAANNAIQSGIQSAIQNIRDQIQGRRRIALPGRLTRGFSSDPFAEAFDPFEAMAYGKGGLVTKAPPRPTTVDPTYFISIWGQGSVDREERDITFLGLTTNTTSTSLTSIGGLDVVRIGLFNAADALVLGGLGSYTSTDSDATAAGLTTNTRAKTPGGAFYMAYINGGFSFDFSYTHNWTSTDGTVAGVAFAGADSDSQAFIGNVQYRFDLPQQWWWEPTAGVTYTIVSVDTPGFADGHTWRLQAGARVGTEWAYGAVKVQPSLQGLVFSDVEVVTPGPPGAVIAGPTDEHYVWGKGIGKVNLQWTDKFSTSLEGEVRGRSDVIGYAGRLMARYTF